MKNQFWAVYNKKGKVVAVSRDKEIAKEDAANFSYYCEEFDEGWKLLLKDGYKIIKSEVRPVE